MLEQKIILFVSFGYMGLLFAIAFFGDKRAEAGKSIISNPYIYALEVWARPAGPAPQDSSASISGPRSR